MHMPSPTQFPNLMGSSKKWLTHALTGKGPGAGTAQQPEMWQISAVCGDFHCFLSGILRCVDPLAPDGPSAVQALHQLAPKHTATNSAFRVSMACVHDVYWLHVCHWHARSSSIAVDCQSGRDRGG